MLYFKEEVSLYHEEHWEVWSVGGVARTLRERKTYVGHQAIKLDLVLFLCGRTATLASNTCEKHEHFLSVCVEQRRQGKNTSLKRGGDRPAREL
jgi:hypothetical protein